MTTTTTATTYHLHVGIDARRLLEAMLTMQECGPIIDGDGWECWGEAVGTDVNDDRTLHVIIPLDSPDRADELVARLRAVGLLTSARRSTGGVPLHAALSDASNWGALDGGDVRTFYAPCAWCHADVMEWSACPNAKDICTDCCGED